MTTTHFISSEILELLTVGDILFQNKKIELSKEATKKIEACRNYLDNKIKNANQPIYGINTGFGSLCDVKISNDKLTKLQENLVMSHACGLGDRVPKQIVKLML